MNKDEAQRIVRQTYPQAWYNPNEGKIFKQHYIANNFGGELGIGTTSEAAWIDAASKLNRMKR